VVGTAGFEPATPCSQSQFGLRCHLRGWRPALVERATALSVVVRWGPFRTSVNGTLVARPLRMTPSNPSCLRFHPDRRVRPVLGHHRLAGKSPEGSRQLGWGDSNSVPPPAALPAHGHIPPLTCGLSLPVVTAGARCAPSVAGRVCTQRVPPAPVPSGRGRLRRAGPSRRRLACRQWRSLQPQTVPVVATPGLVGGRG
jgi:hypothetical protein